MLSASSIESVFQPVLEEIQDHRDRILSDFILSGLEFKGNYRYSCSFYRGAENQALENGFENSVIILFIDRRSWKEAKESSLDSIFWNIMRWELTPATSIWYFSISCDQLKLVIGTVHLLDQDFGMRRIRNRCTRGWEKIWKRKAMYRWVSVSIEGREIYLNVSSTQRTRAKTNSTDLRTIFVASSLRVGWRWYCYAIVNLMSRCTGSNILS